jgi:hypothetical protein
MAVSVVVMIGAVALAVDYGFLADQHRNLQAFADHAAVAGAEELTLQDTSLGMARQRAMTYLRDNLGIARTTFPLNGSPGSAPCANGVQLFTANIDNCQIPGNTNYVVSIHSPGDFTGPRIYGDTPPSLSVNINDTVTNSLAGVIGNQTTTVGAFAEARTQAPGGRLNGALYTDGCINSNSLVGSVTPMVVDGNVYIDGCTVAQTGVLSTFCAFPTADSSGAIVYGPYATVPPNLIPISLGAACSIGLLNQVAAAGSQFVSPTSSFPRGLPPPPLSADVCGTEAGGCSNNHPCKNGTVGPAGAVPNNCYDPGNYSFASGNALHVKNNLNPGVYYVDVSGGGCYFDATKRNCGGVYFEGNTLNANLNGVIGKCWSGGIPAGQVWTSPCPNGFIYDPTVPVDPQCQPSNVPDASAGYGGLLGLQWIVDSFTAGSSGLGPLTNGTYYVRVSALSSIGETASEPEAAVLASGGITVNITASPSATGGHKVYISTASNQEQLVQTLAAGVTTTNITSLAPAAAQRYPLFNNSSCNAGFHNIPHSRDQVPTTLAAPNQNFGVTFVLTGKASFCMGTQNADWSCAPTSNSYTVLLQPYCAAGFGTGSPPGPPDSMFCSDSSKAGPNLEDGAYAVYSSGLGVVQTSGSGNKMGLTGTLYAPRGQLIVDAGTMFTVTPGQIVVHDVYDNFNPVSALSPLSYASGSAGAYLPPGVSLVQ